VEIRDVTPAEYEAVGELTVQAYRGIALDDLAIADTDDYEDELRDVAGRAAGAQVLVAVDGDGTVLGAVTYVPDSGSPMAEFDEPASASIRMLAVAPTAQRRGVGEALTRACIERALATGRSALLLHSTDWMTTAHRMYLRLGFRRDEGNDWVIRPDFVLRAFRLDLPG
jgi:ribosomal protein S18 acetylase RimI-like enzyme